MGGGHEVRWTWRRRRSRTPLTVARGAAATVFPRPKRLKNPGVSARGDGNQALIEMVVVVLVAGTWRMGASSTRCQR